MGFNPLIDDRIYYPQNLKKSPKFVKHEFQEFGVLLQPDKISTIMRKLLTVAVLAMEGAFRHLCLSRRKDEICVSLTTRNLSWLTFVGAAPTASSTLETLPAVGTVTCNILK